MPDDDNGDGDATISLADLVESVKRSANPALEPVERAIEQARAIDEELADAIRYCAIPRWFDAETIGVLRDRPDAPEENQRLLDELTGFSFVTARPRGGYLYHDSTRDPLLLDWQTNPDRQDEFKRLTGRLVAHHERSFQRARGLQRLLGQHAAVLRQANEPRFLRIAAAVERLLLEPVQEALYVEQLVSGDSVREFMNRNADAIQADARLAKVVADWLHDYLQQAVDGRDELWHLWLRYWQARLLSGSGVQGAAEAERLLGELRQDAERDTRLLVWVLADLGGALHQQARFGEASEIYRQELEVSERTGVDEWNLPSAHSRIGSLDYALDRLDAAVGHYQKARQAADRIGNVTIRIFSRLNLAYVLCDLGDLSGAFTAAFEALDIARGQPPSTDQLPQHAAIAEVFMRLFVRYDRWLADTAYAEAVGLSTVPPGSTPELLLHSRYVDLLRESGQLRRAEVELQRLEQHPAAAADPSAGVEVLFRRAMLQEELGDLEQTIAIYTRLIDEANSAGFESSFNRVAAVSNRGMRLVQVGRWEEAAADLDEAARRWGAMGHDRLVALIRVNQADASSRQGRFDEAGRLLEEAGAVLLAGHSAYEPDFHHMRGHVLERQGRLEQARTSYRRALDLNRARRRDRETGKELVHLITVAARRGRWEEAATLADEASALWTRLEQEAKQPPDTRREDADRFNARGLRTMLTASENPRQQLLEARELFEQAIEQVGDNFWYRLNLSYASAALESWGRAAEELDKALRVRPAWLPAGWLKTRLADCHLRHAHRLAELGQHTAALEVLRDTLTRFPDVLPPERLSSLHLDAGDNLLHLGDLDGASAEFTAGLAEASSRGEPPEQAAFRVRLALVAAARADFPAALEELRLALDPREGEPPESAALRLVTRLSEPIRTRGEHRAGREALRLLAEDPTLEARLRGRLTMETLNLRQHELEQQPRGRQPTGSPPDPTSEQRLAIPILLEADNELYPQGRNTPAVEWMIETGIPDLQERIWAATGVSVPGVRISASEVLLDGAYAILLHEVRLARGSVHKDRRFCPDLAGCRALGVDGLVGPDVTGAGDGLWLAASESELVQRAGLRLLDSYQYMLAHLERLLLDRADAFLGLQDLRRLLDNWAWAGPEAHDNRWELRERTIPDDEALVRLLEVLHLLLEERVPIRNLAVILPAFADAGRRQSEPQEVAAEVRLTLRGELPGTQGAKLVTLSPELEEAIRRHLRSREGKRFLAVPLTEAGPLRERLLDELGQDTGGAVAAVVRSTTLRPFVWRLLQPEHPGIPVLAEQELAAAEPEIQA